MTQTQARSSSTAFPQKPNGFQENAIFLPLDKQVTQDSQRSKNVRESTTKNIVTKYSSSKQSHFQPISADPVEVIKKDRVRPISGKTRPQDEYLDQSKHSTDYQRRLETGQSSSAALHEITQNSSYGQTSKQKQLDKYSKNTSSNNNLNSRSKLPKYTDESSISNAPIAKERKPGGVNNFSLANFKPKGTDEYRGNSEIKMIENYDQ